MISNQIPQTSSTAKTPNSCQFPLGDPDRLDAAVAKFNASESIGYKVCASFAGQTDGQRQNVLLRLGGEGACVLGASLGIPYFEDRKRIRAEVSFLTEIWKDVRVMVPDGPAFHTCLAKGMSAEDAEVFVERKSKEILNRIKSSQNAAITNGASLRPVRWHEIENHPAYALRLEILKNEYALETTSSFATDVRSCTEHVLKSAYQGDVPQGAIEIGVQFLVKELAFLTACPAILDVPRITYVYHAPWHNDLLPRLVRGDYDLPPVDNVDCLTILVDKKNEERPTIG